MTSGMTDVVGSLHSRIVRDLRICCRNMLLEDMI